MDFDSCQNFCNVFFSNAKERGDAPFLWTKDSTGAFAPWSWGEAAEAIKKLSLGLRELGLSPGDRVVILSENRPEWFVADFAIMAAGGISVPTYTTNLTADNVHILTNSGACGAIVSKRSLAERLLPAAIEAPACKWVVSMEDLAPQQSTPLRIETWQSVLSLAEDRPDDVEELAAHAKRSDTACLIYTSGTGGVPKGVMLSHGAMFCNCKGAFDLLQEVASSREVFLSFLPLSHSYEHTVGQFFAMSIGAEIYYSEGAEQLLRNLAEVRPTIMTAVPRLYEAMHQRITRGLKKESAFKQRLFNLALELGQKRYHDPRSLSFTEKLTDAVVDRLVRDKVRERFGGRLKAMVSGGAALNPDIGLYFTALGLPIFQGYGQTESAPVVSANRPNKIKLHTVGPPLKDVEVRIAEDGEILVRGELLMSGYWQDEAATASTIRDGWLHTGDIGELDKDGYLLITDRKKDLLVMSGGDNVSPARIEAFLTIQPEIAQAMVYGDKRSHLVALIVPDPEFLRSLPDRKKGNPAGGAHDDDPAVRKAVSEAVDRANAELSNIEKVRRFLIADEAFSVENELMTPTLKVRRHKIAALYGDRLEGLYGKS